eukprot:12896743-Prorocentrum_lima.AAC.1
MVKDCPEAGRAVATPLAEPPVPVAETGLTAPPSADDVGVRRARARPPAATEPTRMEEDGPVQEEYLDL